jgi:hypothetical protein
MRGAFSRKVSRSGHRIFVVGTDQAGHRLHDVDDVGAFPFYSVPSQMFDKPLGNLWNEAAGKNPFEIRDTGKTHPI